MQTSHFIVLRTRKITSMVKIDLDCILHIGRAQQKNRAFSKCYTISHTRLQWCGSCAILFSLVISFALVLSLKLPILSGVHWSRKVSYLKSRVNWSDQDAEKMDRHDMAHARHCLVTLRASNSISNSLCSALRENKSCIHLRVPSRVRCNIETWRCAKFRVTGVWVSNLLIMYL